MEPGLKSGRLAGDEDRNRQVGGGGGGTAWLGSTAEGRRTPVSSTHVPGDG